MATRIIKTVKEDSTIKEIMLPLRSSFFLLGTLTPRGFIIFPLFPRPAYGPSSIAEMLEGADEGEGRRPIQMKEIQK